MPRLKRDPVKYIRDKVKSNYSKGDECYICGDTENLDFHHYHSVAEMWRAWCKEQDIVKVEEVDVIIAARDEFIEAKWEELVNMCATLCRTHHQKLHKIYGKNPALATAPKQARWVEKQRTKFKGDQQ